MRQVDSMGIASMCACNFIAERPDQAVRIAFLAAWLVGMVVLVRAHATESLLVLMLPVGLPIPACGTVTGEELVQRA